MTYVLMERTSDKLKEYSQLTHNTGEPIATRWTPEIKEQVKASRVRTTKTIVDFIAATPADQRPSVLVSGSAVGEI